ncbi:MAG: hypothetical protein AABZ14_04540, partial [Candidatus Margulisiibacteriota bacterium]
TLNGANATVTEDSGTDFTGGSVLTGGLTLASNGAITDDASADLAVTGTASLNAGANAITLGDNGANNDLNFGGLTFSTTGGAVSITEDSGTQLTGASAGDSLGLVSAGAVTDGAGASVTIDNGNASITGTSILLADNAGDVLSVSGTASFDGGAGAITVAAAGTVNFGGLTFSTTGGAVSITEDSGTQLTGASAGDSLGLVSAGAVTDGAGASVTIDNGNASITGTSILLADNAGDVLSVGGNASLTASGGGAITVAAVGTVNFGQLTLNGANATVTEDSGTDFTGTSSVAATLTLNSNGHITQDGPISGTTATFTVDTAGPDDADILLTAADNAVSGVITFAETNPDALRDVQWRNSSATATWPTFPATATINDLTVQHTITGINITGALTLKDVGADSGDLNLVASNGAITDDVSADLAVTGTASLNAGANDITLGDQAGNDLNFGQLTLNGANATVTEDSGTDFTGGSVLTGGLTLASNGAITDDASADLAVTGTASLNAGANAITLGDNGANNDLNFGGLTFSTTGGAVSIT